MKDLQKLAKECMEDLDNIGVQYGNIIEFKANSRYTTRYGNCHCTYNGGKNEWEKHTFIISIASFLLDDNIPNKVTRQVLFHELAHSCKGCMNHGKEWLKIADLINDCYQINIQQYVTKEESEAVREAGIEPKRRRLEYKWTFKCLACEKEWKYKRKPKWMDYGYEPISKTVNGARCPYCHKKLTMTAYGDLSNVKRVYTFMSYNESVESVTDIVKNF